MLFDDDYLNGNYWNGKFKEYHSNGYLKFEGQYINAELNGKGKEYSRNGELIFEGEYLDGKKMEKETNILIMVNYILKVTI